MKAIVRTEYGSPDILQLKEIEKPAPKDGEALVKICAASVNAADRRLLRAKPFLVRLMVGGLLKPKVKILGADIAGRVEAIGGNVKQLHVGDEVFGDLFPGWGGFAEYVCAREDLLVQKPVNLTFQEAAAVPLAALTALHGLRDAGKIQSGQSVVVNGASGGVGTFAVQIAKSYGAEVTGVCSTGKLDLVWSIGADHVVDYTREDFTKSDRLYDLIIAANGYHPILDYLRALTPKGTYVLIGGSSGQFFEAALLGPLISMTGSKKVNIVSSKPNQKDLMFLKELIEARKVVPVIDKSYTLAEVPKAIRYLEEGHALGKIVITIEPNA